MNTLLEHVQAVLSTTPERGQRLVSTLPIDLLTRPPVAGEWSALNCLQHLLDAERLNFPVRFHAFLAGQDFAASIQTVSPQTLMHRLLSSLLLRSRALVKKALSCSSK